MNGLKQRIIGALVLVSLAVIFVPMMFDEPHSERETRSIQIPEEPPFPEVQMPEPEITEVPEYRLEELPSETAPEEASAPADVEEPAQTAQPTAPEPEVAEPDATEPEQTNGTDKAVAEEFSRSLEGAWVVQLGSFGSEENATRLRENVREKGYSSHLQSVTRGDSRLTRVFSGPFAEKAEAERAKQALDKAFGLNSLVTSGGN